MQTMLQWKNALHIPKVSSMQRACAILSSVACLALPYFSTLSHKWRTFRKKKVIEHKRCVFIGSKTVVKNIILRRTEQDMINTVHWSSRKVNVMAFRF